MAKYKVKPFNSWQIALALAMTLIGSFVWNMAMNQDSYSNKRFLPYIITATLATWAFYSLFERMKDSQGIYAKILDFVGKHTLTVLTWHFLAFKIVSLVIIDIYGLPMERLAEFPVIGEYAARGVVAGLLLCCHVCKVWSSILQQFYKKEFKMNMNQAKYTFLLPAYKPDFFEDALRSIKKQTYSDFTVLVSDDCSPHDLKSIFDKVCGDDERFKYRRNEKNMGGKNLVSHWNLLVDMCATAYFILASDDDVYEPTFLEEVDKLARKYPKVDLIRARCRLFNENNNIAFYDGIYQEFTDSLEFVNLMYMHNSIKCIANYVFRLDALKSIGGFIDFPLAWGSDRATVMKLSANGVANTKDVLFSFRMSDVNITFGKNNEKKAYQKEYATQLYDKWFKKFIGAFESKKNDMDAYNRGLFVASEREHEDFLRNEAVEYFSLLSFQHFMSFIKFVEPRLYRYLCFISYLRLKIFTVVH